jgi:serine/threonine protein kinase/ABC-type branched-subunit amino acid transport system substrate-binding protein
VSNSSNQQSPNEAAQIMEAFGRYRLIAAIGRGGMSNVFLAVTEGARAAAQFQKLLVLKVLNQELGEDPEFVRMFLNEARLAARLNHPNIVQTIEVGNAGNQHFLAMEYMEGQPLHRVLHSDEAHSRLTLSMRLYILIQALGGLHYAHERRGYDGGPLDIVHRDISPSNLFVTYDGQVKLMDFGIAKARDSGTETRVGIFKGKPAYISPEQVLGQPVDRRADVYSMGVVLWELITGRRLWQGVAQTEILKRVVSGDVPSPKSIDPRVPAELDAICMKALATDRDQRPATAAELLNALELFAQRLPIVLPRDVGSVVAQAFQEDRERIGKTIEARLAELPGQAALLPDLHFDVGTGSASRVAEAGAANHTRTPRAQPNATATFTAQALVGEPRPVTEMKLTHGWRAKGVALAVVAAGAFGAFMLPKSKPTAAPSLATLSSPPGVSREVPARAERGVTDTEIKLGMSAVFSGPTRELGQNMKLGIETSFQAANDAGGVHGRRLTLTALDDGYEAARVGATMKELIMDRGAFAIIGNVGTPTSVVAAPFASKNATVFFGAFTGAPVLRQDPPDRYVFNYRASYKEETAESVKYLLDVQRIRPDQIVVFAQEDSYGDAGFEGVTKAMRANGHGDIETLRVGYKRNTTDVDEAIAALTNYNDRTDPPGMPKHPVRAVVMVATYRAAAKFIQKVRAIRRLRDTLFFNVSFVGSETLAEELENTGPDACPNVFVTQVVPPFDSGATGVRRYREQLAKYQPQAQPGFVSLEGYIVGSIFIEALTRAGRELTTEKLVEALERIERLDLGFGAPISYSMSEHQGSHRIWGTRLDASCQYQPADLD